MANTTISYQLQAQSSLASVINQQAAAMRALASTSSLSFKELTSGLNASTRASAEMRRELADTGIQSKTTGDQVAGLWKQVAGGTLVAQGIRAVAREITGLVEGAVAFGTQWQTTMQQIQGNTLLTASEMRDLGASVTGAMTMGTAGFDQLAHSAQYAADYGYRSAADNAAILDEAQKKVTGSGGDASQIASTLALTMHEYGAKASEAAQYTDVMTIAAARGRMTFEQLAESGGQAIGIAANLKVPIDQVTAAISALTQHGYDSASAATQVTAILTHIIHPASAAAKEFDNLAQKTGQQELASKNLITTLSTQGLAGVIADLKAAYTTLGYSQDQATQETMYLLAAQRGGLGMATLLGTANLDYNATLAAQAQVYSGQLTPTQDSYTASLKTLGTQEAILNNNMDMLRKSFSDGLTPALTKSTTEINANTRALEGWNGAAKTAGQWAGAFASAIGNGLQTLGSFSHTLEQMNAIMVGVVSQGAVQLGLETQAEANASFHATGAVVDDAKRAADATANSNAKIYQDAVAKWGAIGTWIGQAQAAITGKSATNGAAAGSSYTSSMAAGIAAGMTGIQAREAELVASGDLRAAFSVMGKANAEAFVTSLATNLANASYVVASAMGGIPIIGAQIAAKFKAQGDAIIAQLHATGAGGGDPFAKQAADLAAQQKKDAAALAAQQKKDAEALAKQQRAAAQEATSALDRQINGEQELLRLTEERYAAQDAATSVSRAEAKLQHDQMLARDLFSGAGQSAAQNLEADRQAVQDAQTAQNRTATKAGINDTIAALQARKAGGGGPVPAATLGALPTATLSASNNIGAGVGGGGSAVGGSVGTMTVQAASVIIQTAGGGGGSNDTVTIKALCPECLDQRILQVLKRKGSKVLGSYVMGSMG